MKSTNQKKWGILLVLIAAISWGVSGTVAQFLFDHKGMTAGWLVSIRLLCSGIILLSYLHVKGNKHVWDVWKRKSTVVNILIFGLFGMLGVQYTYFVAIETSNAATATLLQYLAPVLITVYVIFKWRKAPQIPQVMAILFALLGTFLLVTSGNFSTISIHPTALVWGISSAFFLALYTLQPIELLKEFGSTIVIAWGMIIGGIGMSFIYPPWSVSGQFTTSSFLAILFVIVFGTLIAFFCYLESLKYLEATESSLLACAEPLSSAFLAVVWLKVPFGIYEWLGACCIIATILLLSLKKSVKEENPATSSVTP